MVIGGTNARDVYVSDRTMVNDLKFSFHASGKWRLALAFDLVEDGAWVWDDEGSPLRSAGEDPRIVTRLTLPPLEEGWRHALNIVVSEPGLQRPFREKRVRGASISWWSAPTGDTVRTFGLFISDPGVQYSPSTFPWRGLEVGAIELPEESHAVVVSQNFYRPAEVELVRTHRKTFEDAGHQSSGTDGPLFARIANGPTIVYDMGFGPV
ncbi:hypothetical protein CVS53_02833 [Microbacterium oxydans]|jgi:hypothetical protein|nr:hypothetical protein CVS53_02833 [Microbacterium oxydans]